MSPRPRPLRAQLLGLCLAVAAPLAALEAWNLYSGWQAASELARRNALHLAEITASQAGQFIGQARNIVTGLASRPAVAALDPGRCDPILADFLALAPRFANALTMDLEGNLVCSGVPLAAGRSTRVDPVYDLQRLRETGQITIGKPARGSVTGGWVVTIAHPLRAADGRLAGAVALSIDLRRFPVPAATEVSQPDTTTGILSADGTVLARSLDPERSVGTSQGHRESARRMLRVRHGTQEEISLDGVARVQGFAPVPGTDWIAVAGIPAQVAYAGAAARGWRSALLTLAILSLALLLAARSARAIRDPIAALAAAADDVAAGDLAARAPVAGCAEIAAVATQFNRMLDARGHAEKDVALQLEELRRWHRATLGREDRVLQLKREIDGLRARLHEAPRYLQPEHGS